MEHTQADRLNFPITSPALSAAMSQGAAVAAIGDKGKQVGDIVQ